MKQIQTNCKMSSPDTDHRKNTVFPMNCIVILCGMYAWFPMDAQDYICSDSITKELKEIEVVATTVTKSGNKTTYRPPKTLVDLSNSSVQLLAGLQIPELVINPTVGSIEIFGNGNLSIRINGRPASDREVALLDPKNIVRVDYVGNPGIRYRDADGVLDVITRRPKDCGIHLLTNIIQSFNRGWGDYSGAMTYNVGKSELSINYHSNPMWNMDCYRNNTENITLADGTHIAREESGLKIPNRMVTHLGSVQYSYADGRDLLINIQPRFFHTNDRYRSRGEISTTIDRISSISAEYEENLVRSWQGDIDIYLFKKLGNRNNIYINIIPTVIESESEHIYETDNLSLHNRVANRGYRLIAEGIWETRLNLGSLSAGVKSNSAWNRIINNPGKVVSHNTSTANYLFAEWKAGTSEWQWGIGAEGVYFNSVKDSWGLSPRVFIKYSPSSVWGVGFNFNSTRYFPNVNELNTTTERIDAFKWSKGNHDIHPYTTYVAKLEMDLKFNGITAELNAKNELSVNPITFATLYLDDHIVQIPVNSQYNHMMELKGQVRIPLINEFFILSAEFGWHRYYSRGANYRHRYSQPFYNLQLMFMKKGWLAMVKYNDSYNRLWGEMITSSTRNLMNIGIGYTYRSATFMGGVVNPFGNVAIKTRNLSSIAGYDRMYQASGSNTLVWFGLTLNIRKGKSRKAVRKKLDNASQYESVTNSKK